MKFTKTFLFLITTLGLLLVSCGGSKDEKTESEKSSEAKVTSFAIGANQGEIDEANKKITLIVPYGTDVTSLVPAIGVSNNATVSPATGTAQNFTNAREYMVNSEDGMSNVKYTVTVIPAKVTGLSQAVVNSGDDIVINGFFATSNNTVVLKKLKDNSTLNVTIKTQGANSIRIACPTPFTADADNFNQQAYEVKVTSFGVEIDPTTVVKLLVTDKDKTTLLPLDKKEYMQGYGSIILKGSNLKGSLGQPAVYFPKVVGQSGIPFPQFATVNAGGTQLSVVNPPSLEPGDYEIYIDINGDGKYSNRIAFTVIENTMPAPTITKVPATSPINTEITIEGTNFGKDPDVVIVEIWQIQYGNPDYRYLTTAQLVAGGLTNTKLMITTPITGDIKFKLIIGGRESNLSNVINITT